MKDKKKEGALLNKESDSYKRMKDHLYSGKAVLGEGSPFSELLQDLVNGILEGEMEGFLSEEQKDGRKNKRNGYQKPKRVISNSGALEVKTPRDREGDFVSELLPKRQTELNSGLDDQILALYAQGNSYEDVRRLLVKMFGVTISAGKISAITDKVLPIIEEWRNRRLQPFYAVVYMDAIHFKIRHEGKYRQRASYTVYAIDLEGNRDILGLYIQGHEGATRWCKVLEDLQRRGLEDVLVFCTDDLKGFSETMNECYPSAVVQKCIVHAVRSSLRSVDDKDRRKIAADLRKVYTAADRDAARVALNTCRVKWGEKYAYICDKWERQWDEFVAFMDFPKEMRKMIYTTNPVEALHRIIRKLIKGKAAWVSDTALIKQLYLSLMHNKKSWNRKAYGWKAVQREIIKLYPERIEKHL